MEAAYPAPSPVDTEAWTGVRQPKPKRAFRVRRSLVFAGGYFLFQSMLLFADEAADSLVFAGIFSPLLSCLFYGYLVRSEEKQQIAHELQTLAERVEDLLEESKQRAAEKVSLSSMIRSTSS